jgi:tripartite-type tricarboxylate transporter receptor subunit TctC
MRQSPYYPNKPLRMIVPLALGGGSDTVTRIVSIALTEYWGQSMVVDNRPGSGQHGRNRARRLLNSNAFWIRKSPNGPK